MTTDRPDLCSWFPFSDEPLLPATFYVPKFCDPCVIMPSDSCDGKWHMFVHSWLGIHHFVSNSGIAWEPQKVIEYRGHSPFIFRDKEYYCLIYEKHDKDFLFFDKKKKEKKNDGSSRIEMRTSTDLITWSNPRIIFESKEVQFAKDYIKDYRISRPQLFKIGDRYRLYFGASYLTLPGIKQKVSRYLGYAESDDIKGPYEVSCNYPIIESDPDDKWTNLACGNVRLVQHEDGFYAFQCGVYWNEKEKNAHSALTLIGSADGINFRRIRKDPVLVHSEKGWSSAYIMSSEVHWKADEKCWYCYFCANDGKRFLSNESVGLIIGTVPVVGKKRPSGLKVPGTLLN